MSKNFGKRSTTASASTSIGMKKFCKVCHDAGKTESEYTSHYVRSSTGTDGVVVCPTLLAMNCRYCGTGGHTVKFCKELEKKKKAEERGARRAAFEKSDKKVILSSLVRDRLVWFDSLCFFKAWCAVVQRL